MPAASGDQCTLGLNFSPLRPLENILNDYRSVLERVFDPAAYAGRLDRLMTMLDRSDRPVMQQTGRLKYGNLGTVPYIVNTIPEAKDAFGQLFRTYVRKNPAAARYLLMLMAYYLHLRPFSQSVIAQLGQRIAAIEVDRREPQPHAARQAMAGHA
jgi:hypothetical protein